MKRYAFRYTCIALIVMLGGGILRAQAPAATPSVLPSGPLVAKNAPEFAAWTVTSSAVSSASTTPEKDEKTAGLAGEGEKKAGPLQVMQIVKTGEIRFVKITAGTSVSERWCKGAVQIIKRPEWKQLMLSTGENRADSTRIDFSEGDFGGFDWVSSQNFIGVRKVSGRDCLVFKDQIPSEKVSTERVFHTPDGNQESKSNKEPEMVLAVACTDLETRLPVALTVGKTTTTYKFETPPSAMLSLPAEYEQVLDGHLKRMQSLLKRPGRP